MYTLTTSDMFIAFIGGMFAGAMNTIAGYGSIITLTILIDIIGLPPTIANGTNRVNVFFGMIAGAVGSFGYDRLHFDKTKPIIITTVVGAILGIYLAIIIDNEQFKIVFKYLVLLLFIVLLLRPKRWLFSVTKYSSFPLWKVFVVFFPLGIYGGFIQMGMGLFFIAAMVFLSKYTLIEANMYKILIVLIYTTVSLFVFQLNGFIEWKIGLLIGLGAALSSYATAKFMVKNKNANTWAYRVLVVIVLCILINSFIL